jgi:hypothetical protein
MSYFSAGTQHHMPLQSLIYILPLPSPVSVLSSSTTLTGAMNRSIDRFLWSRDVTLREEEVEVVVVKRVHALAVVGNVVVEVTVAAGNAGSVFRLLPALCHAGCYSSLSVVLPRRRGILRR